MDLAHRIVRLVVFTAPGLHEFLRKVKARLSGRARLPPSRDVTIRLRLLQVALLRAPILAIPLRSFASVRSDCGSAGASPSLPVPSFRGRVSGQAVSRPTGAVGAIRLTQGSRESRASRFVDVLMIAPATRRLLILGNIAGRSRSGDSHRLFGDSGRLAVACGICRDLRTFVLSLVRGYGRLQRCFPSNNNR